jgi:hypothetical protein
LSWSINHALITEKSYSVSSSARPSASSAPKQEKLFRITQRPRPIAKRDQAHGETTDGRRT